jgi:hypothetical protein
MRHHHHRRFDHGWGDDDDAVGPAPAIGATMKAGATTACGIRGAKARDRACDENRCENIFHDLSLHGPHSVPKNKLRVGPPDRNAPNGCGSWGT